MQRSGRIQWLSWTLVGCLAAVGTSVVLAQSPSKPNGSAKSGISTNNRNNARPAARPPTGRTAQPATRPATTPAPTPVPQSAQSTRRTTASSQESTTGRFTLQHRLKTGEVVRTRTVHEANTVTRVQGTEDVSQSKTVSDKVWEIHSVSPEGLMTLEYRIDAVEMSQKQGDKEEITYNSLTDKEAPEIFSRLVETIAKPIAIVTIDPSGTVIERDNKSKAPPMGMGELALPLPSEPVAIGGQWSIPRECRVKLEDGTQKVIKLREQYTLEKVSAGVATIRIQSHPLTPVDEPSVEAQLMQQMNQGVAKFDVDRGRLISKQLDWDNDVVGFGGAESSLKYTARFTEEAMPESARSANTGSIKSR